MPLAIKKPITNGNAGVIQPAARGSPKIIGLEVMSTLAIKHAATASFNVNQEPFPLGPLLMQ